MMKMFNHLCIILLALTLSMCSTFADEKSMVKTEIYFGLSNKLGPISDSAWYGFRKKISKNFSAYTETRAHGYWTDINSNSINEETAIIVYIHESSASENAKIDSLIRQYKKIFNQESVLKTDHEINVSFYN